MSEQVEARLETLLGEVSSDPFGNRIPELDEGRPAPSAEEVCALEVADEAGAGEAGTEAGKSRLAQTPAAEEPQAKEWEVARVGEPIQAKPELIASIEEAGIHPGAHIRVLKADGERGIRVGSSDRDMLHLAEDEARHLFLVRRP